VERGRVFAIDGEDNLTVDRCRRAILRIRCGKESRDAHKKSRDDRQGVSVHSDKCLIARPMYTHKWSGTTSAGVNAGANGR
jgi:hypothetical protein